MRRGGRRREVRRVVRREVRRVVRREVTMVRGRRLNLVGPVMFASAKQDTFAFVVVVIFVMKVQRMGRAEMVRPIPNIFVCVHLTSLLMEVWSVMLMFYYCTSKAVGEEVAREGRWRECCCVRGEWKGYQQQQQKEEEEEGVTR